MLLATLDASCLPSYVRQKVVSPSCICLWMAYCIIYICLFWVMRQIEKRETAMLNTNNIIKTNKNNIDCNQICTGSFLVRTTILFFVNISFYQNWSEATCCQGMNLNLWDLSSCCWISWKMNFSLSYNIIVFTMRCSIPQLKLNFSEIYICYVHVFFFIESLIKSRMKPSTLPACAERPLGGALPWKTLIWEAGESCTRLELQQAPLTPCWQG